MVFWTFGHGPAQRTALRYISSPQTQQQMEHTRNISKTSFWVLKGMDGSLVLGPGDETEIVPEGSTEYIIFELATECSVEKTRSCKNRMVQISSPTKRPPSEPTAQGEQPSKVPFPLPCHETMISMTA